ncbi:MAG: zf-HC2 domain-containing protein, partial [Candidatus Dormibacteraeota bacterium]|nr:zf-HC2 domain-containing protein [Candidatus Dormibacteraeota bacterium]
MKKCQPRALTPYVDGELADDARAQVEEHLRGCAPCGALLEEVTSARERVHGMGRAVIPNTVLMPALEAFRERAGIGEASRLDGADVPEPITPEVAVVAPEVAAVVAAEVAPEVAAVVAPEVAVVGAAETAEVMADEVAPEMPDRPSRELSQAEADARYEAIVAPAPASDHEAAATWVEIQPAAAPETEAETEAWQQQPGPMTAADDEPGPPLEMPPARTGVFAAIAGRFAARPPVAPRAIPEPPLIPEPTPMVDPGPPAPLAKVPLPPPAPEVPATEAVDPLEVAPWAEPAASVFLPWEHPEPVDDHGAALNELPDAPTPHQGPPWVEADAADAEDMEARGRRLVEEDLTAQWALEKETETVPPRDYDAPLDTAILAPDFHEEPATVGPQHDSVPSDEVAVTIAGLRGELGEQPLYSEAPGVAPEGSPSVGEEYRQPLPAEHPDDARSGGIQALGTQVKIGIGAAAAIVLLLAAVLVVPRLGHARKVAAV